MNYWLIKSEASCYSIDDMKRDKKVPWSGIRNYQARNFMRDGMQNGDLALFYHSNGTDKEPTGVYGITKVSGKAHSDETQFDSKDEHFDPKATKENPIWQCVDMAFVQKFNRPVTLIELKRDSKLEGMAVRERGSRLSILPVSEKHFKRVLELAGE